MVEIKKMTVSTEILTVSQLSSAIKQHLEGKFLKVCVQGEISNLKEQSSGHLYFTLKDIESQISAVLFKGNTRGLTKLPKNGDQVILTGELSVYLPRGSYQLIVRELKFSGVGALLLKLHEMKLKLQERGWFDKTRKRPLPRYPQTIGVITSPTGSVIQDILHILSRRLSKFHLILNPVKVQGEGAAEEIAKAIEQFNRYQLADLLIIGRGGGSLEDLWPFNEEVVASALFHSKIPTISAVGHETDYCIADFVADLRAPTPSAAAEIATRETLEQLTFLTAAKTRLTQSLHTLLSHSKKQLQQLKRSAPFSNPYIFLEPHLQRIDSFTEDLATTIKHFLQEKRLKCLHLEKQLHMLKPAAQLTAQQSRLRTCEKALHTLLIQQIRERQTTLSRLIAHLKGINPKNLLKKGFCILLQQEHVITSVHELKKQEKADLILHDGKAELTVNEINS
jgi:exodeoxyribonuclease VII large subunit